MATKSITLLLLLSVFLLSTSLAVSIRHRLEDNDDWEQVVQKELQSCKNQCRQKVPKEALGRCDQMCEELAERARREHVGGGRDEEEEERRREHGEEENNPYVFFGGEADGWEQEVEQQLQSCKKFCRDQVVLEEQRICELVCEDVAKKARREHEEARRRHEQEVEEQLQRCKKFCRDQVVLEEQRICELVCEDVAKKARGGNEEKNPYVFRRESFVHRARTQHGSIRVLQNFLQRSSLLLGIANYRLEIFEANPRTFAVPKQSDAEQIFFVAQGEGTVTLLRNEESRESHNIRRESHDIRKGDIVRVRAGTVVYIINNNDNRKLQIVKLVQPVSTPGQFQNFYIGGGDEPESIYRTFSTRILEAALNTQQEKLERLFGKQREGEIVEASEEQIRGLSGQPSEGGHKPFNLLQKRPDHSNNRGQLYTADFADYEELRDLDVHVTFTNITGGSMMAPFYESKATVVAMVVDGDAEFEMVCPHLSSQGQEEESQGQEGRVRYQKVMSRLTRGNVLVIPAGHPTAIVASSQEQNLQMVWFQIHSKNNRKVFLTGRNNVVNQMEREAKELTFGVPSQLVEDVFGGSKDEVFVRGPMQSHKEGRSNVLKAFLEFASF